LCVSIILYNDTFFDNCLDYTLKLPKVQRLFVLVILARNSYLKAKP